MSTNASTLTQYASSGSQSTVRFGATASLAIPFIASLKQMFLGWQDSIAFALQPATPSQKNMLRDHLRGVLQINSLAREMEKTQPNQAAELHMLSSRD